MWARGRNFCVLFPTIRSRPLNQSIASASGVKSNGSANCAARLYLNRCPLLHLRVNLDEGVKALHGTLLVR